METLVKQPSLESIAPNFGNSFSYKRYDAYSNNGFNQWHYHPEIELTYVHGGSGKRQIGSHVSYFRDGDLMLIGSNLPHCGFTTKTTGNKSETIIQMKTDFLGNNFFEIPEMKHIQKLFEMSKSGISFHGKAKLKIGDKMETMEYQNDFQRLLSILSILNELARSEEFELLNADGFP